jgi:aryl-alcohol dehydrogenase-like predicted oxidoreductase
MMNIGSILILVFKYSPNYQDSNDAIRQQIAYAGNNVKSMHISVEASLKKLRTSYIDILYVAWWDWETSVEEVMNGLHVLVQQGKVLYLVSEPFSMLTPTFINMYRWQGISDSPAWVVSKANQYARDHGKSPFVIYQGAWNIMLRDLERDVLPMARSEGRSTVLFIIWCLDSRAPTRSCACSLARPCRWKIPNRRGRGTPPADRRERPHETESQLGTQ